MKKVIKNKVYDTAKAEPVASASVQTLFRKKTGEFFIYTDADPANLRSILPGYRPGRSIYPLTYDQAVRWAALELSDEERSAIFAQPDDDAKKVRLGVRVSATSAAKLQRVALERGISQAVLIDEWIKKGM